VAGSTRWRLRYDANMSVSSWTPNVNHQTSQRVLGGHSIVSESLIHSFVYLLLHALRSPDPRAHRPESTCRRPHPDAKPQPHLLHPFRQLHVERDHRTLVRYITFLIITDRSPGYADRPKSLSDASSPQPKARSGPPGASISHTYLTL